MLKLFALQKLYARRCDFIAEINFQVADRCTLFQALQAGISHCLAEMIGAEFFKVFAVFEETDESQFFQVLAL